MFKENPRFFIAYAHADKELYQIFLKLFIESKPANWHVWSDDEIELGRNWSKLIKEELLNTDYIIVLLSPSFSTSAFAKNKILNIYEKSKIIPILIKAYLYPRDSFFAESQVFLYARNNANLISFEEWQVLSNNSDDINGTFSNSFIKDLIAFIKDGNAELLLGEEMANKSGILHLNNCGLSEWPVEVFQMTWLRVLNLGNYYNDFDQVNNNFIHSGDKSIKTKNHNSISQIDPRIKDLVLLTHLSLERNSILQIENLENNNNLKLLELGGNKINKIEGLQNLINLESLYLYTNEIDRIEGLETLQNLKFLYSAGNKIQNLEGLSNLNNLQEAYLFHNSISKMISLDGLPKLMKLNLNTNLINEIEPQNLPALNWLSLDNNKLKKIKGLENLNNLQYLHLENNQISKMEGLITLTELILLHLEKNQITKIEDLDALRNLQELDLQRNYIEIVEGLSELVSLTKLNLSENKIQTTHGILDLNKLKYLIEVNFKKNPFTHDTWLNQEILESVGNDKEKFFAYLQDQNQKRLIEDYIPPLKIILLGNSEDGKTSLALKLIHGWDTENNEETTHGLKIRKWKIDDTKTALLYDFGGQDYYHASYNMFFTWNTGYILVWDANRQESKMVTSKRNNDPIPIADQYRLYSTGYWLGNLEYWKQRRNQEYVKAGKFDENQAIKLITVQNLFDNTKQKIIQNINTITIDYQQSAYLGNGIVNDIDRIKRDLVYHSILDAFSLLFKSPFALSQDDINILENILNIERYQVITLEEFKTKYVNPSPYLLDILHSRGIVLCYSGIDYLKDIIWLSPSATSEEIFSTLSKNLLGKQGRVDSNLFKCEERLKNLMIFQEIIFENIRENDKKEYIVPAYLPYSPIADPLLVLAMTDIKSGFTIRFKEYMPHGLMGRLICRLGKTGGIKHFYRDLLIFSLNMDEKSTPVKVMIKVNFEELSIEIKSNVDQKLKQSLHEYLFYTILLAYWNYDHLDKSRFKIYPTKEMNALGAKYKSGIKDENKNIPFTNLIKLPFSLSLDGEYFIDYENHFLHNTQSVYVPLYKWNQYTFAKEEFRASFNAFTLVKKAIPKKIFISYSSKDSAYMKRFITHLESLKRIGLISYWVDRMIETGTSWDETIRQEMESSDMVIFLLSPDFLATPYIIDFELPKAIEYSKRFPNDFKIEFIQLTTCAWKLNSLISSLQMAFDSNETNKVILSLDSPNNDKVWNDIIDLLYKKLVKLNRKYHKVNYPLGAMHGQVKLFEKEKGVGFIVSEEAGNDVFFHSSNCIEDYEPSEGDMVLFELGHGVDGRIAGTKISPMSIYSNIDDEAVN